MRVTTKRRRLTFASTFFFVEKYLPYVVRILGIILVVVILYLNSYMWFSSAVSNLHNAPDARIALIADPQMEGDGRIVREGFYGKINVVLNDYYFRHIVSNIMSFIKPTHVVVLGDLFSNQQLNELEFYDRWKRYNWIFDHPSFSDGTVKLINITGNHDIGYADEVSKPILSRFERSFGPVNTKYETAGHILAIVNSLNIDNSTDKMLSKQTMDHLVSLVDESEKESKPLILLTHVPLYKPKGTCVDDPLIWEDEKSGVIYRQWVLTKQTTNFILNKLKPVKIFNGHDHYGCYYEHNSHTTEYTIQSIMGAHSGYIGVFEIISATKPHKMFKYNYQYVTFLHMYSATALIVSICVWIGCFLTLSIFKFVNFVKGRNSFFNPLTPANVKSL